MIDETCKKAPRWQRLFIILRNISLFSVAIAYDGSDTHDNNAYGADDDCRNIQPNSSFLSYSSAFIQLFSRKHYILIQR